MNMRSLKLFVLPVVAGGTLLFAQTYNTKPKPQTYGQAIQYEKDKDQRAAAAARSERDPFDEMSNADRSADRSEGSNAVADQGERKTTNKGTSHRKAHKNQ